MREFFDSTFTQSNRKLVFIFVFFIFGSLPISRDMKAKER